MPKTPEERKNYETMLLEEMDYYFQQHGSRQFRVDMALEAQEAVSQHRTNEALPGIISNKESNDYATVTRVSIVTQFAAENLGKPIGNYITIEAPDMTLGDRTYNKEIGSMLANELKTLIKMNYTGDQFQKETFTTLLCGLGNWNATPDAVGPMVVEKALVTRHVYGMTPPEKRGGLRAVSAIAPGVLGITGIETSEVIGGVVSRVKPDLVIVIDALASRNVSRLGTTIQLGDSGIQPGSGIGNKRAAITKESLGVPVIAIGVPTVVHALTIVADAMEMLNGGNSQNMAEVAKKTLQPHFGTLVVTPKEIDMMVENLSDVIAGGINYALHPAIDENEIYQYLQ